MSEPLINISKRQALIFAVFLVSFEFLTYITNDMIMPGMLEVVETFHANATAVADSVTVYLLGGASLQIFIGPISDAIGRRPVMIFGSIIFIIFTLLVGLSQSMPQFLVSRYLQGMGLCFLIIGYAVIQEIFAEMDAVRLIALMANISTVAPLIGPLLGAVFILHFPWRNLYWVIASCAIFCSLGIWYYMPETIGVKWRNGNLNSKAAISLRQICKNYLDLLTNNKINIGTFALGILSSPCLIWIGLSPIILMEDAKLSVINYALLQIPFFAACIMGNVFLRFVSYNFALEKIIFLGSTFAAIGLVTPLGLSYFFTGHYLVLIVGFFIYGFGLGITVGPLTRYLLFLTPVSKGTTNAYINVFDLIVMSIATEFANLLYHTYTNNYVMGFICASIAIVYYLLIYYQIEPYAQHKT
ncbi:MAG: hypothetical protein A3F18_02030 [Legionellales bacterium RIFCSPHIGHO2_12_FULL_37_14]|nr:MAG: hypothetical protein A3F18_02030 [Legionellales bacterium RIFCSPHIGHO2_12_FULL_37_14]